MNASNSYFFGQGEISQYKKIKLTLFTKKIVEDPKFRSVFMQKQPRAYEAKTDIIGRYKTASY